jgi:TrmH family RNA methyltransferase
VATPLGAHNQRVALVHTLRSPKGRHSNGLFAFEGPTLLAQALDAQLQLEALYVTPVAYEAFGQAREAEARGVPVFLVDERSMRKMSDVETPTGVIAVTPLQLADAAALLARPGTVLLLADLNDPGNAGTLLRSAEAFGLDRVIFGAAGVDPHHPKVVRAAMGSLLRLSVAVASPQSIRTALQGWEVTGLSASGRPLAGLAWPSSNLIAVGSERDGLAEWEPLCTRLASIPMSGRAESLNAAVAGSIALYEAARRA